MKITPTRATKASLDAIRYPVLASPKIDGIRAVIYDGRVMSRTNKPIPNLHVQKLFAHLHSYDGELVVGAPNAPNVYKRTQSGVLTVGGEPDVKFLVFDDWRRRQDDYIDWYNRQHAASIFRGNVQLVPCAMIDSKAALLAYEAKMLEQGYEGLMLRNPHDRCYTFGDRQTSNLQKLKRFADSDAEVLGIVERVSKDGQPQGTMGALQVRDIHSSIEFSLGAGFSDAERAEFWAMPLNGKPVIVKYKYFPQGDYHAPRFPSYLGIRDARDILTA